MADSSLSDLDIPPGFSGLTAIGSGSAAQVYRAHDDTLSRTVALKLFTGRLDDDPAALESFRHECATASRLGVHPGVVPVFSGGVTAGGRPWLCMRFVEGGTLARALRDGQLAPTDVLRIGAVIADTLAWAHSLAPPVLHCDVKPGNILLTGNGTPLLTDFGISTPVGPGRSSVTVNQFTQAYAAPEVLFHGRYSPASEVWSLAATLLEALTGAPPFEQMPGEGVGAFIQRVGEGLPPDVGADVPEPVRALLRRALTVDRDERWPSATSFATAIRQTQSALCLPVTPILDSPPPSAAENPAGTAPRASPGAGRPHPAGAAHDPAPTRQRRGHFGSRPFAGPAAATVIPPAGQAVPLPPRPDPDNGDRVTRVRPRMLPWHDKPTATGDGRGDATRRWRAHWWVPIALLAIIAGVAVPVGLTRHPPARNSAVPGVSTTADSPDPATSSPSPPPTSAMPSPPPPPPPASASTIPAPPPPPTVAPQRQKLTSADRLTSPNGEFVLRFVGEGDLVLLNDKGMAIWYAGTPGHPDARLEVTEQGRLVVYSADGESLWDAGVSTNPAARLRVHNDGNLVLEYAGTQVWSTGPARSALYPGEKLVQGQSLVSEEGRYAAWMQYDGNFCIYVLDTGYATWRPTWEAGTGGTMAGFIFMQYDGNLAIYPPGGGIAFWGAGTHGSDVHLELEDDGKLVLFGADGVKLWSRHRGKG